MTADERLDQLEPLLSEALTVLDRHTYQLKQLSASVSQLTTAVVQQGDNISFLLREQLTMKTQQGEMKAQQDKLKAQQDEMNGKQDEMNGKQDEMNGKQNEMNGKLDQLLQLLQKPGQ